MYCDEDVLGAFLARLRAGEFVADILPVLLEVTCHLGQFSAGWRDAKSCVQYIRESRGNRWAICRCLLSSESFEPEAMISNRTLSPSFDGFRYPT